MDDGVNDRELSQRLDDVANAESRLLDTLGRLDEPALRVPSLLPGWTRGHVLAHVALNAHSLVNLFEWARTGMEKPQYPSWAQRDAAIETFSTRTLAEHRAALEDAGAAFATASGSVPLDRWSAQVAGIGGDPQPAETFLFGRLREVEIHHVDLDAGYVPSDWDDAFVRRVLDQVPGRLAGRAETPFTASATDLGLRLDVGEGPTSVKVSGPGHQLLAWLLGRTDGSRLDVAGGTLPQVPDWG